MKKMVFYCPVNGWDCPYWRQDNTCAMVDEDFDPTLECDDAAFFYEDEIGEGTYFVEVEVSDNA